MKYILTFNVDFDTNQVTCLEIPNFKMTTYGNYEGTALLVHHLVASRIPNPNPAVLTMVDHINGDTHYNHPSNLRHISRSLNAQNIKRVPKITDTCVACWYKNRKVKFANQFNKENKTSFAWWEVPMQDDVRYLRYFWQVDAFLEIMKLLREIPLILNSVVSLGLMFVMSPEFLISADNLLSEHVLYNN